MYDTEKESWADVKKEFGVIIEAQLRTFAKTLQIVTSAALKNKKDRLETYKNWLQKVLKKVYFFTFLFIV